MREAVEAHTNIWINGEEHKFSASMGSFYAMVDLDGNGDQCIFIQHAEAARMLAHEFERAADMLTERAMQEEAEPRRGRQP